MQSETEKSELQSPSIVYFSCDLSSKHSELCHFWEHTIGSGHATLALRADWQSQIKQCHREIGVSYVRFHGILSDDMGTLIIQSDKFLYSFFNADQIFDYLLSIGMKPFVELSFMPTALSSGDKIVFHYRGNVTMPRNMDDWATLIRTLVGHWVERYGINEVEQWFFEVWNEPNLDAFGSGKQDDYFKLYRATAEAIKAVDQRLKVGGPATAKNEWISDFRAFCEQHSVAADFVSTHHYPTDAFGKPGDDTETQLAESTRSVMREQMRVVRREAGDKPLYYTEWSSSSNPRDPLHDEPYAATFIVKTIMEANGLAEAYSYWTFSDIFEENYFPSVPFHGGFGLLNIHGIAKPSYRAYEILHQLGHKLMPINGNHPTVDLWVILGDKSITLLFTNYAQPRHAIKTENIHVTLNNAKTAISASLQRIDADHANAKRRWQDMGSPEYLSLSAVNELHEASRLTTVSYPFLCEKNTIVTDVSLPPLSVTAITLRMSDLVV